MARVGQRRFESDPPAGLQGCASGEATGTSTGRDRHGLVMPGVQETVSEGERHWHGGAGSRESESESGPAAEVCVL